MWARSRILTNKHVCKSLLTDFIVAVNQDDAQVGGLQPSAILYRHIVPLADVVDVDRYAGIRPWRTETGQRGRHLLIGRC